MTSLSSICACADVDLLMWRLWTKQYNIHFQSSMLTRSPGLQVYGTYHNISDLRRILNYIINAPSNKISYYNCPSQGYRKEILEGRPMCIIFTYCISPYVHYMYDRVRRCDECTHASGGIQEGYISEVGSVDTDVSGVFDVALRGRDHAALDAPLAGIRVTFDVAPQEGRTDWTRGMTRRVRGQRWRCSHTFLMDNWSFMLLSKALHILLIY